MALDGEIYLFGEGKVMKYSEQTVTNVPHNGFTHGMLTDSNDLFVVYNQQSYPPSCASQILDNVHVTKLDFTVRSYAGFPKDGIIFFEHPGFAGNGKAYSETTSGVLEKASAMIVTQGVWELYGEINQGGPALPVEGKTQIGVGKYSYMGSSAADSVKSIKRMN